MWPSPSGKGLEVIIVQLSSFTKKLLPVPIESEVFTHKVPHLFLWLNNGSSMQPLRPSVSALVASSPQVS